MKGYRVVRGGSFGGTWGLRSALRYGDVPGRRYGDSGFRIVIRRKP